MNTIRIAGRVALIFVLAMFLGAGAGCKSSARPSAPPVAKAPPDVVVKKVVTDSREKRLQEQIGLMQEQIGPLTARTEALARFHGSQMGSKWVDKVQAAREDASNLSERLRYLEATKTLLARKLNALRTELKVYEEFELSDPTIPRP